MPDVRDHRICDAHWREEHPRKERPERVEGDVGGRCCWGGAEQSHDAEPGAFSGRIDSETIPGHLPHDYGDDEAAQARADQAQAEHRAEQAELARPAPVEATDGADA